MDSKPDLDSLHPLQSDEFLPPISRWTTLGGLLVVGVFSAAVTLASVIEYNITVRAIANVRPSGEVQIAQAETGGTVRSVKVRENQVIKKGEVIANINDPRLYELQNQKRYWQGNIQQEKSQLNQVEAQLVALDSKIFKMSGAARPRTISVESELSGDISQDVENALAKIARSQPENAERLDRQRDILLQVLDETHRRLNDEQHALQRIEAEMTKSVIRAQSDGKILKLDIRNPGQTVRPGDVIAQIVPSDAPLVVKAKVAAQDIGEVKREQQVQLRVSAYPYPDYGTLTGKVTEISPDALPCQGKCLGGATAYYEVNIQPQNLYLVKGDRQYPIQPGMEVTADIISRKERVITFLLRKASCSLICRAYVIVLQTLSNFLCFYPEFVRAFR